MMFSSFCKAQNDPLAVDEQGKFIYYEAVDAKDLMKSQLKDGVYSFLKQPYKDLKFKTAQGDSVFIGAGKLIINKTVLVISHPSGEILYRFQAEIKDGKYRFWLSDFNFIPYQRDRYGNFVASSSKGMPLETDPGKLNAGQWIEYQIQTAKYARQFAVDFKEYLAGKVAGKTLVKERTVVKKEW